VIDLEQGVKWAILVSRSTTTSIELLALTVGRSVMKSIAIDPQGRLGIGRGCRSPNGQCLGALHYNNMGLFYDPNIIANNKERNFQKPAITNHNSSQTLDLLRYHNIRTRTIASPSQLPNLIKSQTFPIITASIHCLRLTLYRKLFATNPSPQRLSESTQNSIGFLYKIRRKHFGILKMPLKVCD
jgi:hypothetical protein